MLPARRDDKPSLADVLSSCLAAVGGEPSTMPWPRVDRALVVLVDGLGAEALDARAGHARFLARASRRTIESGFPTTTAAALASLTTGTLPGTHGIVGYTALDPVHDRLVNQLNGWDADMVPEQWQSTPTLFERARDGGLDAVVIGPPRYASSGFTHAVLRGARYLGAHTVDERVDAAIAWLRSGARGIGYLYVPELDVIAHAKGWSSPEWTDRLEGVDAALARLAASLGAKDAVVVTADHGVIDLPASSLVAVGAELLAGVAHVAGEPRALQLHADTSADIDGLVARWTEREGSRAWVATRDEVQSAGWWGPVSATVAPRLGDVLVIARKAVAYYTHGLDHPMVGHHGALSSAELRVPLIPLGAFGN